MTTIRLPSKGTRPNRFLVELIKKSGTFWQVCELAKINLEGSTEDSMRRSLSNMQMAGLIHLDPNCITWHATPLARRVMAGEAEPVIELGEVAGPAYRGVPYEAVVWHVVRS